MEISGHGVTTYSSLFSGFPFKLVVGGQIITETSENAKLIIPGYCNMANADSILVTGDISVPIEFSMPTSVPINNNDLDNNKATKIVAFPNPFNSIVTFII